MSDAKKAEKKAESYLDSDFLLKYRIYVANHPLFISIKRIFVKINTLTSIVIKPLVPE